jgi:hypothetical protein
VKTLSVLKKGREELSLALFFFVVRKKGNCKNGVECLFR